MFFTCRVQVLGIVVVALIWINGLSTMEEIPDIQKRQIQGLSTIEKKIQGFQWPAFFSMMLPTPSCIHHQRRQENLDRTSMPRYVSLYIVASLDSHLWVLLFLFLLITCSIIGLLLRYLLQTLESVRMTEPQLQHCWVHFRSC